MSILNGKLRYGAPELKSVYNNFLLRGFGTSVVLHSALLFALMFIVFDQQPQQPVVVQSVPLHLDDITPPVADPSATKLMNLTMNSGGGAGGDRNTKAPVGKAMKGIPTGNDRPEGDNTESRLKHTPKPTRAANALSKPVPTSRPVRTPSPVTRSSSSPRDTVDHLTGDGTGPRGQRPNGTGDKPAGGSGGDGIGFGAGTGVGNYSTSGLGGRGWQIRPGARYPDGADATGNVVLRFTIEPDGTISNIVPVKRAAQPLVNAATSGLRRARLRPLPESVPQVNQTATITYSFDLK